LEFESLADQSLSDVKGYDPCIHHGTPEGVFDTVRNMFAELKAPPLSRRDFRVVYEILRRFRRTEAGRGDPYTAVLFGALVMTARGALERLRQHHPGA
jgi:hypothetical protein